MDDFTQRLVEKTRARQEALQQKKQQSDVQPLPRKRRPLASQNSEGNVQTIEDYELGLPDKQSVLISQSPNKRTKTDSTEDTENVIQPMTASDSDPALSNGKVKQANRVNQRMQKLLNQRKIWEAEEKGENVSFDEVNLPSPVQHNIAPRATDQEPVFQQKKTSSSEQESRKRRLAALAARVKGWEDDTSHHDPPKTPEGQESSVKRKPPSGRTQLASAVPVQKLVAEHATAPEPKEPRQEADNLSVDSLAKFAGIRKVVVSPAKRNAPQKSSIVLGNNAKTVLQTKNQTITVNSYHGPSEDREVPQNSRTLQQRMVDLQNNGITEADLNAMNTSSASLIMERARAEREKELEELRNRKVHGMKIHGMQATNDKALKPDSEIEVQEDIAEQQMDVEGGKEEPCNGKGKVESVENRSHLEDEVYTSACDKSQNEMDGDEEDEEDEGQELSYSDSLLDEDSTAVDEQEPAVAEESKKAEDDEMNDIKMIDKMFEGVLSDEERAILTPPRCSGSPIIIPSLTRQKSRLEIKSELNVRKQTCNEAEDTHKLSQPSKFQKTCLSKSNSTESIVSLCQENDFPVYTISDYRTEKRRQSARFDKRVVRNEAEAAKASMLQRKTEEKKPTQDIIADMMEQVSRQQRVIQQASAALNCCYDAQHGKGTVTEVEAEKLLLISSEKRLALIGEIQLLKQKKPAREVPSYKACPGALIINNIRLPLRTEYIFSLANKREAGEIRNHYYFVLVRHRHQMYATQLVSTLDDLSGDSLVFKDQFKIDDLKSDYKITLEVYSLNHRTRADGIPLQDKSKGKLSGILHKRRSGGEMKKILSDAVEKTKSKVKKIKQRNPSCLDPQTPTNSDQSLTPKKLRTAKRTSHLPSLMSPGGPNAIRISNFTLIGSTTITLKDIGGRKFALQKVPFLSPISGQILCKLSANFYSAVEQKGFLTMFDDVGGLGAWHRRWCALRQGRLYSWTYPDDEQHKKPLMTIALRECISHEISTVERILCARPNTFELRTMRPRRQGDRQNLISEDTGSVITTKHWLSADTKEERVAWIECLNQALADVRAWDSEALKPFK